MKFAKKLARRLLEVDCSAIIDISDLKSDEKRLFVRLLVEGMLSAPKSLWRPRLVVIDEAHKVVPEGREAESRQSIIDLMDSGRKRGLGGIIATQRLSKVAKDCIAEANNWMVGRCAQDVDLRRISDLVGFTGRSEWDTLRNMLPGEFLAMGPAFEHAGVMRFRTNSRTETAHPRPGSRHLASPPKPSAHVRKFVAQLGEFPLDAVSEEDDSATLRARIAELESKIGDAATGDMRLLLAAEQRRGDELNARLQLVVSATHAMSDTLKATEEFQRTLSRLLTGLSADLPVSPRQTDPVKPPTPKAAKGASRPTGPAGADRISGAPLRLLAALLQHGKSMGRTRAALLAQLSPRSSTFRNAMSTLRSARPPLMRDDGQDIAATDEAAVIYADSYSRLPTGAQLIAYWRGRLGGAHQRLFDVLVTAHGPVARDIAAAQSGLSSSSSTFRNAMSKLRGIGLLCDGKQGAIMLTRELL